MTDTELKELIEDCCNEIANKIEPLANVKARLYASLKPAINFTRCCEINGKGLCDYSDKLGLCPRCDTDAYSR